MSKVETGGDGAKWWLRPVRSQKRGEDEGFMILSTRTIVQVREEKNGGGLPNKPNLDFGEEVFLIAETAMVEATEGDKQPVLDLKAHGIFRTLEDANATVKEISEIYRTWYAELDRVTGGNCWNNSSQETMNKDDGFFWVGMRTRMEVCSLKVHKVVVA